MGGRNKAKKAKMMVIGSMVVAVSENDGMTNIYDLGDSSQLPLMPL